LINASWQEAVGNHRTILKITGIAGEINQMLDSGKYLDCAEAREFWTCEKRRQQADVLDEMASIEREAWEDS